MPKVALSFVLITSLLLSRQEPTLHGRPVSAWIADLQASHELLRERAAWALGKLGQRPAAATPALVAALRGALTDPEEMVRLRAAGALALLGGAAAPAVPDLLGMVTGRSRFSDDTQQALRALAQLGAVATGALVEASRHQDPEVRAAALEALGGMDAEVLRPHLGILLPALADPNRLVQVAALKVAGRAGARAKDAVPRIEPLLDDPAIGMAMDAALSLLAITPGHEPALKKLDAILGSADADDHLRVELLNGLPTADPTVVPLLRRVLAEERPAVRLIAAGVLLRCDPGDAKAREVVAGHLDDVRFEWAMTAAEAWCRLGPEASSTLEGLLKKAGPGRGVACAAALVRLGLKAPLAEAILRDAVAGADAELRSKALAGLGWAGAGAAPLLRSLLGSQDDRVAVKIASLLLEIEPEAADAAKVITARLRDKLQPASGPARPEAVKAVAALLDPLRGNEAPDAVLDSQEHFARQGEVLRLGQPAVPALLAHLADSDPEVRFLAASLAWRITRTPGPAFDALLGELSGGDRLADRSQVLLGENEAALPAAVPKLTTLLGTEDERLRGRMLWLLGRALPRMRPPQGSAPAALRTALERLVEMPAAAALLLALDPAHERAAEVLVAGVSSTDEGISRAAFGELMSTGHEARARLVPRMVRALEQAKDPAARYRTATSLLSMAESARPAIAVDQTLPRRVLTELLTAANLELRTEAAIALLQWFDRDAATVAVLVEVVVTAGTEAPWAAAVHLWTLGDAAVPPLLQWLTGERTTQDQCTAAATELAHLGAPGVSALDGAAKAGSPQVRWTVAWALRTRAAPLSKNVPEGEVARILARLCGDPEPWVRFNAAQSRLELDGKDLAAVPILTALLRERDDTLAEETSKSLTALGAPAVEPLKALLQDPVAGPRARKLLDALR